MSPAENKPFPENILFKYGPLMVYLLVFFILIEDLFGLGWFSEIRWQHVVLLGGLLIIPFLREIDRVFIPNVGGIEMNQTLEWKETMQEVLDEADFDSVAPKDTTENINDFESDIDSYKQDKSDTNKQQNNKTSESEENENEKKETQKLGGDIEAIENEIYSLAETNPRLAMSQLGTQLEHGLRHLVHTKGETPGMSFYDVLDQLEKDPEIDSRFLNIADEIRQARNEAVHAAEFESDEMYGLIDVGLDLLRYINNVTKSDKIPDDEPPIENI